MVVVKSSALLEELSSRLNRTNRLSLPRMTRVVVNVGVGKRFSAEGKKSLEPIIKDLVRITGQQPAIRAARKSIASFKLREGTPSGLIVTLRGKRAEAFLARLVQVVLPRTRDFRGIPVSAVDRSGNISIGIREQIIFPETAVEPTGIIFGMEVTVVTTAKNRDEGELLLRLLGFPLQS